ncbi:MAG TPA: PAS domain-containing protein [Polyangiaceae bacterium]|nr:PAS domain-containing protein [Polyangiaceae bacterium]
MRTRHLRAEESGVPLGNALTEREAVVAEVERLAKVGSWVWDVRSNQVAWSSELFRILGYDQAEVQPTAELFFESIHPDDLAAVRALSQKTAVTGETEPGHRCRVLRKDGSVRAIVLIGSSIRDSSGELVRIVGAALDVTDFVETENELRRTAELLNQAQQIAALGSWTWNVAADTFSWSETLCSIVGVDPKSEVRLSRFLERVHPEDQPRVERFRAQLRENKRPAALELRIVRPDGVVRRVVMDARLDVDSNGNAERAVGTVLDVTTHREMEEKLGHAQKLEAVGTLAGGLAHDFNNYLIVIRGNLELLAAARAAGDDRELLDEMQRATERCATLTRQLLTFGRKQPNSPRLVQLEQIVSDSTNLIRRLIGASIELVVRAEPGLPPVMADPSQIELVIVNLAVNARDAMHNGGRLLLELEKREVTAELASTQPGLSAGEHVVLRVSDTGIGIPDQLKSRVFEPFFTTKKAGQGSGLGLATVYGVVQQCGGHIELHSQLGQGTSFRLSFPARSGQVEAARGPQIANGARGELVLLVEDEPSVRRLTRRLLERGGYRVVEADNGLVALEVLGSTPGIDLVLTDITMPKLDGLSMARRIRALDPHMPIVLMSGYPDADALGVGQEEFGQTLMRKPFTLETLLERVRTTLDKKT